MSHSYLLVERHGGLYARPDDGEAGLESLSLQDGCIAALQRFSSAGFRIVLLVDPGDDAVRRAAPREPAIAAFTQRLLESQQCPVDTVLGCPHGDGEACDCALPGIGLVADLNAGPELDRATSVVVGDRTETGALARALGIRAFDLAAGTTWNEAAHAVLDRPRRAEVRRTTRETDITVAVDLDRVADPAVSTGIGFFDHMLEQLGKHGGFELRIACAGDLEVDEHHTVEDVALAVGQALREALGDKRGIGRYGFVLPMDEAQAQIALDLSGRAFFVFEGDFGRESVGGLPTELVGHFFRSLSDTLGAALHVSVRGENAHHMVEACFKGVARALRQALARQGSDLPSTKGAL